MSCFSVRACLGAALLAAVPLAATVPAAAPRAASPDAAHRKLERAALAAAKKNDLDQAFLLAQQAAQGQDGNTQYVTLRELLRQRATLAHLRQAHLLVLARHPVQAADEFRAALAIDPSNLDARQGLADSFPAAAAPVLASTELRVHNAAPPVEIAPRPGPREFHLHANLHQVIAKVADAYGLRAYIADGVPDTAVRLDVADASFAQAMAALHDMGGVDWIPLDSHTLYFAAAGKLAQVEPLALRTFYLPWVNDGVALNEINNTVKSLLGIKQANIDVSTRAITVRATPAQLDAAESLLLAMHHSGGDVVLEVKIVEVDATTAVALGVSQPDQFTMFALGPLLEQLEASLASNASQDQAILQLFEQGGINAVLNSGLLSSSQLSQAQSISPLLQNPFVTFGGGATLMGISVPNLSTSFSSTSGSVSTIESARLRATSGQVAEIKIGQRYPIITASFAASSISPALSSILGSSTGSAYQQPLPSFTYEDLGLDAKMTPVLSPGGGINLKVEVKVDALAGTAVNGIPILSNRSVTTAISLRDNEPVVIAGLLDRQQIAAIAGLPGLSLIPGLGSLFSTSSPQSTDDQLLLVVTPHIVKRPEEQSAAIWLPPGFAQVGNLSEASPGFLNPAQLGPGQNPEVPNGAGGRGPRALPGLGGGTSQQLDR